MDNNISKEITNANNHIKACEDLMKESLKYIDMKVEIDTTEKFYKINIYNKKKFLVRYFYDVSTVLGFVTGVEYANINK